jgi:protein-disulfide isomerase
VGTGSAASGPSKKDRRDHARELARLQREEAKKKARRRKWYIQGGIGLAVVAALAIVAVVIVNNAPASGIGPKNMQSNGILLTSTTKATTTPALKSGQKPVATKQSNSQQAHITVYVDYQCPYCDEFESTNSTQIGQWLDNGIATYEVHPLAILDASSSGTKYSSRSANAAACVANYKPSVYFAVNTALFANQPKEGSTGLTNAKIISILDKAGAGGKTISDCVNNNQFASWVTNATQTALKNPVPNSSVKQLTGTPLVIVNGQQYQGSLTDASAFLQFVGQAVESSASGSTATPSPSDSSTPAPESTPGQ